MATDLEASLGLLGLAKSSENLIPTQVLINLSRQEQCVCGHTISDIERENIESLIHSHSEVDPSLGSNTNYRQLPSEFSYTSLKVSLETYLNRLAHLRGILAEKKSQLASLLDNEGNFGSRNSTFKELKAKQIAILELQGDAAGVSERIQQIEGSLKVNELKLTSLIEKDSMQAKIAEDRESIVRVKDHLSKTLANYKTSFRDELTSELNALVKELIFDPVKVNLGEDFQFDLISIDSGQSFGGSGGQNKAKAMAMIIALYRIASRRISKGESINNNDVGSFPLIIDSAFGELGLELRNRVAKEITREAGQSIFFVSETQAQGVVDSLGESSISSRTLLHSFVTGHGTNQVEPLILGKKVTWITFNSDRKRTEIEDLT
jgi:DNA sulfur modification protein DndD